MSTTATASSPSPHICWNKIASRLSDLKDSLDSSDELLTSIGIDILHGKEVESYELLNKKMSLLTSVKDSKKCPDVQSSLPCAWPVQSNWRSLLTEITDEVSRLVLIRKSPVPTRQGIATIYNAQLTPDPSFETAVRFGVEWGKAYLNLLDHLDEAQETVKETIKDFDPVWQNRQASQSAGSGGISGTN